MEDRPGTVHDIQLNIIQHFAHLLKYISTEVVIRDERKVKRKNKCEICGVNKDEQAL